MNQPEKTVTFTAMSADGKTREVQVLSQTSFYLLSKLPNVRIQKRKLPNGEVEVMVQFT